MQQPDLAEIDLDAALRNNRGNPRWRARAGTRTFSERHPGWEENVTRAQAKGYVCTVERCGRPTEDLSTKYCTRHRDRVRKYGHPTAGNLPRKHLGPWIVLSDRYVRQLDALATDHPAKRLLTLARHWWQVQINQASGYEAVNWRPHQPHEIRWRRHVSNITRHGFDADRVLSLVTAFYVIRELYPAMLANDQHELYQLARLVLQSVTLPYPSWHPQAGAQERPGIRFMLWAGDRIMKNLGVFCGYCAAAIMGQPFAGVFPALEDQRPVSRSAAARAATRPQYRPLTTDYDPA